MIDDPVAHPLHDIRRHTARAFLRCIWQPGLLMTYAEQGTSVGGIVTTKVGFLPNEEEIVAG